MTFKDDIAEYEPMIAALQEKTGIQFCVGGSGGTITGLEGVLETGQAVMISDYAGIGLAPTAAPRGYLVGIYTPDPEWGLSGGHGPDHVGGGPSTQPAELPAVVASVLAEYARGERRATLPGSAAG